MLFSNAFHSLVLVGAFAGIAIADANSITSGLKDLRTRVTDFNTVVGKYDGGMMSSLNVARHTVQTHRAVKELQKRVDESGPISEQDAPAVQDEMRVTRDSVKQVLNTAATKDQTADQAGTKMLGSMLLTHFSQSFRTVDDATMAKLPANTHREIHDQSHDLSEDFRTTIQRFT